MAVDNLRNELFDDISDSKEGEQTEGRKRARRGEREDIRTGTCISPTKRDRESSAGNKGNKERNKKCDK